MFPGIFEWIWDPGHIIFMGIVWLVVLTLLLGVVYVLGKTISDTYRMDAESFDHITVPNSSDNNRRA